MLSFGAASLVAAATPTDPDWLSYLLQWGPGGVVLGLVITGILEPKRVRQNLETDRNSWKDAFETERSAHQVTRDALAAANARAEAAVESAQTMTKLLESLGHRPIPRGGTR